MIYAERLGGPGEPYIAERGVFLSIEEFAPYRRKGWEGTPETNAAADAYLQASEDWRCRRCDAVTTPEYGSCGSCGWQRDEATSDCRCRYGLGGRCTHCDPRLEELQGD